MSVITSENYNEWQALANSYKNHFPSVGKTVKVIKGRKYKGLEGVIKRHQVDQYFDTRYSSNAQVMLREMKGREGYIVLIQPNNGSRAFWVKANYVEIIE